MDMTKTPQHAHPSSRAQWLLDFSQSDFPNMSDEERQRWGTELGEFSGALSHDPKRPNRILDPKYVEEVWQTLRTPLQSIGMGHVWSETVEAKLTSRQEAGIVTTVTELFTHSLQVVKHAAILFAKLDGALAVCANGPCGRFFIKKKRQTYCTTRCRDTVNKRAYRKRRTNLGTI